MYKLITERFVYEHDLYPALEALIACNDIAAANAVFAAAAACHSCISRCISHTFTLFTAVCCAVESVSICGGSNRFYTLYSLVYIGNDLVAACNDDYRVGTVAKCSHTVSVAVNVVKRAVFGYCIGAANEYVRRKAVTVALLIASPVSPERSRNL